jgi:SAM-dependent methyltransferase
VAGFDISVFRKAAMDAEQAARSRYFERWVAPGSKGLEIGPLTRPTFVRSSGFTVQALDHASTENLREKYRDHASIDVDSIIAVDWVWTGGAYTEIPGIPQDFDFVISCHSIEHSLDLIQFLTDISALLADDGRLFLVTPHRQLMFDFYRPLTTLGDVLMGHYYPKALDMKARVDELELASVLNGRICWSQDELLISQVMEKRPIPLRPIGSMPSHLADLADWHQEKEYRDGHRWVFQPESLTGLISSLRALGMCDFKVVDFKQGVGCEFMMVLEKSRAAENSEFPLQGSPREILLPPGATQTGLRVLFTIRGLRALMRTVFLKTKHYAGKFLRKIGLR